MGYEVDTDLPARGKSMNYFLQSTPNLFIEAAAAAASSDAAQWARSPPRPGNTQAAELLLELRNLNSVSSTCNLNAKLDSDSIRSEVSFQSSMHRAF
jgi:hypothetical protein